MLLKSKQIKQPIVSSFSGSFTGSLEGTSSWAQNVSGDYVKGTTYVLFSSSYIEDSSSFDNRINNMIFESGSIIDVAITTKVATTTTLPRNPIYNNGNEGIDSYLSASLMGVLGNIDGVSLTTGDSILVKNQTNKIQNGVYNVITTGSNTDYYILKRSTNSDEGNELDSQVVIPSSGNVNKRIIFTQTTPNPIIGVNDIIYSQQPNTLVSQTTQGTQRIYQIPFYTGTARQLSKGSNTFTYTYITSGSNILSSSLNLTGSINISGSIYTTLNSVNTQYVVGYNPTTKEYSYQSTSSLIVGKSITSSYVEGYIKEEVTSSMFVSRSIYSDSSSYALTASYVLNPIDTSKFILTSSFNQFTSSYYQDSSSFKNNIDSLTNATSSYISNSQTSSMSVLSSSYALTASYALNPLIPTQVSQLINDSGYITSSALAPYLTTASAAATYQPILVSGTTIKTINGTSLLGSGDITISAAALSSITAATSSNIIHNGNFTQEWTWNSISNQSGLKLSSTANGTTTNGVQKLFESVLTGAMFHSSNLSYAGYFDNQQTVGGARYGIYARGYPAGKFDGNVSINGALDINTLRIWNNNGLTYLTPLSNQTIIMGSSGANIFFSLNGNADALVLGIKTAGTAYVYGLGCYFSPGGYTSKNTTAALIERNSDKLMFSSNSGLPGNYNTFTPTFQLTISGATNNIGIGTTSPDVSAKLDVSSTTQGFAPPEMTATKASAISTTSRKLIIYVTDTNGTFTSAGLWMWNGTIWKLILAE